MKNHYMFKPAELSDVELPEELLSLSETIAKNVHEVCAQSRIAEGWTYGEKPDDAFNTLKLIIKMGFEIRPKK